jgi:hypothetical protein
LTATDDPFRGAMRVAAGFALGGLAITLAAVAQQDESGWLGPLMTVTMLWFPYIEYWVIARLAQAFKTPSHLKVSSVISGTLLLVSSLWLHWALFIRPSESSTDGLIAIPCIGVQVFLLAPVGFFVTPRARPEA